MLISGHSPSYARLVEGLDAETEPQPQAQRQLLRPKLSVKQPQPQQFGQLHSIEFKVQRHRFKRFWDDVVDRSRVNVDALDGCTKTIDDCDADLAWWQLELEAIQALPAHRRLGRLNRFVNEQARFADDQSVFGKAEHWATPKEFLKGSADCEDFAIFKFFSLLRMGYKNDQLRVVIVRDPNRAQLHAVLTVEDNDQVFVLDSLHDHVMLQSAALHYQPVHSFNLNTHWAHFVTAQIRSGADRARRAERSTGQMPRNQAIHKEEDRPKLRDSTLHFPSMRDSSRYSVRVNPYRG